MDSGAALDGVTGGFLDGYFIVNRVPRPDLPQDQDPGRQFNISALYDGTLWEALDFGVKEGYADYINSILCDHEELILFGRETIEVWRNIGSTLDNSGVASFPFAAHGGRVYPRRLGSRLRALLSGTVHMLARRHSERPDCRVPRARIHARTHQHVCGGVDVECPRFQSV